ncbi:MAG: GTP-binding protein [Planctomycetaceae bacterium]|nr:GTP-binding protein [Planctomycetaceae bacterium]
MTSDLLNSNGIWYRLLTAPGPGAVAVIELDGESARPDQAERVLGKFVTTGVHPLRAATGRICYGCWNAEDLIVVRISRQTWEIQCHGGTVALEKICSDLNNAGARNRSAIGDAASDELAAFRAADTRESLQRQLRSVIDRRLAHARSRKTAGLILAQASNSLGDDLQILLNGACTDNAQKAAIRRRHAEWNDVAEHLTKPWRVVLAGAPNVGKSSLLNAIAGMERSIVSNLPGTTRDAVEVDTLIDGWSFRFVDTAGIRQSSDDEIEQQGIRLSRLEAAQCDILCVVFDHESGLPLWNDDSPVLPKHTLLVRNKADLRKDRADPQQSTGPGCTQENPPVISVSAHTGEGLTTLLQWIKNAVVPVEPTSNTVLPLYGSGLYDREHRIKGT